MQVIHTSMYIHVFRTMVLREILFTRKFFSSFNVILILGKKMKYSGKELQQRIMFSKAYYHFLNEIEDFEFFVQSRCDLVVSLI